MKKMLALLLALVLIAGLVACANDEEEETNSETSDVNGYLDIEWDWDGPDEYDIDLSEDVGQENGYPTEEGEEPDYEQGQEDEEVILIITGRYGQGTHESNEMVSSILGGDNSQERFNVYFNWYNIIHEIGHIVDNMLQDDGFGEIGFMDGELFANSFAVAFWARYGDEETFNMLSETVAYAIENFERPVAEDEDIFDFARLFEAGDIEFNFNNYGWFQFSLVNHALTEIRDLASLLTEAGHEFSEAPPPRTLTFSSIGEDGIPEILASVFSVLREWGIEMPSPVYHILNDDPNMHAVVPGATIGMIELWGMPMDDATLVWPS